jgi:hypothetical protein
MTVPGWFSRSRIGLRRSALAPSDCTLRLIAGLVPVISIV